MTEDQNEQPPAQPQDVFPLVIGAGSYVTLSTNSVEGGNQILIIIKPDGSIQRGPAFTTVDAAALEFWDAVERLRPKSTDGP